MRQLLHHASDAQLIEAERRVRQCARCDHETGLGRIVTACASTDRAGEVPSWNDGICWNACERYQPARLRLKLARAGFPRRLLMARLDEADPAGELALAYVELFEEKRAQGDGLTVTGPVGVGKSSLLCGVVVALMEQKLISTAAFWSAAKLLSALRPSDDLKLRDPFAIARRAKQVDILVLDDLGEHKVTEWAVEQFGEIIDDRWSNSRPTLISTNSSREQLQSLLGERVMSRLLDGADAIGMSGDDRRRLSLPAG